MPNVDATLDALYALRDEVGKANWKPEEVRRRRAPDGEWELVLVDPATQEVRPGTPTVRYRPTTTDYTHVAELGSPRRRRSRRRVRHAPDLI